MLQNERNSKLKLPPNVVTKFDKIDNMLHFAYQLKYLLNDKWQEEWNNSSIQMNEMTS